MRAIPAIAFFLLAVRSQAAPVPSAFFVASEAYDKCLSVETNEQDDGISDAATIADAVQPMCEGAFIRMEQSLGMSFEAARRESETAENRARQHQDALRWVLVWRKTRRHSN